MNALSDPFKQLIERRLWPIALLLVIAVIAVPLLLSKSADESAPLPTAAVVSGQGATESLVSESDPGKTDRLRAVLGDRKDPFRPAQLHHVPKPDDGLTVAKSATTVNGGSGDTGGTGAGGGGETVAPPVATATPTPLPTYDLYSLQVRFGPADGPLETRNVKRLTGLPKGPQPAALYLGLVDDHKAAVFIIDAGVQALGDGQCNPSPEDCQTLTLRKGETEFLTRGDQQWELDLVDIIVKKTSDAAKAKSSRKEIADNGREKLRSLVGRIGRFDYDESKGTLTKLSKAQQAKRVAKAARMARTSVLTSTG